MNASSDLLATLDASRKSWIEAANDPACDFSIQNLPFGIFSDARNSARRVGVAIGDSIVDLAVLQASGLLRLPGTGTRTDAGVAASEQVFSRDTLNDFIALGRDAWRSVRIQLSGLLSRETATLRDDVALRERALVPQASATLHLPVQIPGYTDFYSSKEHATNVGSMFRDPKNALLPNWSEMPIGYNGRASSVVVSGTPVRRPNGQLKLPDQERPVFGGCRKLDIELETGFIVGRGNALGEPIACADAEAHIFGMVLLNDWSARDIQQWEYVPLGPFNAKTFATTISPWIVTLDALEPFRSPAPPRPGGDLPPLPYLQAPGDGAFRITLEVWLRSSIMPAPVRVSQSDFVSLYWTLSQMIAHHTSNGCPLVPGDLIGSGTVSGPEKQNQGCLLELTHRGAHPLQLPTGETRAFLEDGDEVILRAYCEREGCVPIGFGDCRGIVAT